MADSAPRTSADSKLPNRPPSSAASLEDNAVSSIEREYATFFNPTTHKFDTVDFRIPSSKLNLQKYFPKSAKERKRSLQLAALLGIFVGIVIGIAGFFIDQILRAVILAIYKPTDFFLRLSTRHSFFAAVCCFSLLCCAAVLVSSLFVVLVAPLGAGSGIPELKAYLNGVHVPGFLRVKTLFVKVVGVALSIGGGLICGKQGPIIHAGAIIGAGMSQGASAQFRFRMSHPFRNTLRFLRTNAWKRDFAAVGAAIGVAVAFGAPMGGWVWVYEEACTHWTWALGLITLGGCLSGVVTVGFLNFLANGMPNGGFRNYVITNFGRLYFSESKLVFPLFDVPMYLIIGVIGGIVGAILPVINKQITLFRYKRITLRANRVAEALFIALLTAVSRIAIPKIANSCIPVNESFVKSLKGDFDYSQFNCPDGQFSIWAATFYNPTSSIVRALLYADDVTVFPAGPLVASFFLFFFFIIWTYGVAVPAGVFFPGFVVGSIYGRLCGVIMQAIFPGKTNVSMTGYAFLGAVSALAGITRTISVAIIALEALGKGEAFFGSIVVALVAKVVGDKLYSLGIYDLHIQLKGMPFLTEYIPDLQSYNMVQMKYAMETNVVGVRRHSKVCEIVHVLRTTTHHSFPVFLKLANLRRRGYVLHQTVNDIDDGDTAKSNNETISEKTSDEEPLVEMTSSIITPTPDGKFMQATRFEAGSVKVVKLGDKGNVEVVAGTPTEELGGNGGDENEKASEKSTYSADDNGNQLPPPINMQAGAAATSDDFGLVGMVTRDILLAVLEKLLELKDEDAKFDWQVNFVHREKLDSAWPNSCRQKREDALLNRIEQTALQDFVVDLHPYIDPDPLLISGDALTTAGYRLLRSTGARHMLVTNMRIGRVVGIVTRKDILPNSIREFLGTLKETKVE